MKLSDLQEKEVVNCLDGKRIGCVSDIQFDEKSGDITAIIIQENDKFLGFFGGSELIVPWDKIKIIGKDVIIVDMKIHCGK